MQGREGACRKSCIESTFKDNKKTGNLGEVNVLTIHSTLPLAGLDGFGKYVYLHSQLIETKTLLN